MAQSRCLGFGLSHLGVKTGQFKPLGSQLERSLKSLFHEPSSLNDHFLSVAITKPSLNFRARMAVKGSFTSVDSGETAKGNNKRPICRR
jgi:hypothetical protein